MGSFVMGYKGTKDVHWVCLFVTEAISIDRHTVLCLGIQLNGASGANCRTSKTQVSFPVALPSVVLSSVMPPEGTETVCMAESLSSQA